MRFNFADNPQCSYYIYYYLLWVIYRGLLRGGYTQTVAKLCHAALREPNSGGHIFQYSPLLSEPRALPCINFAWSELSDILAHFLHFSLVLIQQVQNGFFHLLCGIAFWEIRGEFIGAKAHSVALVCFFLAHDFYYFRSV